MRTLLVAFGLIVCAIVVSADQRKAKTHTITIEGMRFQPEVLTVSPGDTIVWVNKDIVPHTATSKAGTVPPTSARPSTRTTGGRMTTPVSVSRRADARRPRSSTVSTSPSPTCNG